jgi:carbonic anhydrase
MAKEINYLIDGYKQFHQKYFDGSNTLYKNLGKHGQKPRFLVIACSDSRVDPAIILQSQPGDLFVVRNVANLVPPYEKDMGYHGTSAALEFAILGLNIKHIIVLGHSQCGGIRALLENAKAFSTQDFVSKWMELAQPACEHTLTQHPNLPLEQQAEICGKYALINSLEKLKSFPWIQERVLAEKLYLHGWYFDIGEGLIYTLDQKQKKFQQLK